MQTLRERRYTLGCKRLTQDLPNIDHWAWHSVVCIGVQYDGAYLRCGARTTSDHTTQRQIEILLWT